MTAVSNHAGRSILAALASNIAAVSRIFLLTLSKQISDTVTLVWRVVRRTTRWLWNVYTNVETGVARSLTDLLLLVWAIRTLVLLLAVEFGLIYLGTRWHFFWLLPALLLGVVFVTSAAKTVREFRQHPADADLEVWPRARPAIVVLLRTAFRIALVIVTAYASLAFVGPRVKDHVVRELLNVHQLIQTLWPPRQLTHLSQVRDVSPSSNADPDVFSTYFSSGVPEWTTYSFGPSSDTVTWTLLSDERPRWKASGGTQNGGGNSVGIVKDLRLEDVVVTAHLNIVSVFNEGHHAGIVARFIDTQNFYEVYVNQPSHSVYVSRIRLGRETKLGAYILSPAEVSSPVQLQLTCHGSRLSIAVNGRRLFDVIDDFHRHGRVGVINAGGATEFLYFSARAGGA